MTKDTSGFYRLAEGGDKLNFAPNCVAAPTYKLERAQKDTYTYPNNGWSWFDNEDAAYTSFGIAKPEEKRRIN